MKVYRVKEGEYRFFPLSFGLVFSPTRLDVTASFPLSDHPSDFTWEWNRLCGVLFFDHTEAGVNFRHNPHTNNIELCGYYSDNEERELTDYVPLPFKTITNITMHISDYGVAFRFDVNGKVYIRSIDRELNPTGLGIKLMPKMRKPAHADFALLLDV